MKVLKPIAIVIVGGFCACARTHIPLSEAELMARRVKAAVEILQLEHNRIPDSELLLAHMKHPESIIRQLAIRAAGRIGGKLYTEALLSMLGDEDEKTREDVVFYLGISTAHGVDKALIERYQIEEQAQIRLRIIESLGRLATPRAVSFLVDLLKSTSLRTRVEAARAVGVAFRERAEISPRCMGEFIPKGTPRSPAVERGSQEAVAYLIAMLEETSLSAREVAASALYSTKLPSVFKELSPMLREKSDVLRRYAVLSSARIPNPDIIGLIVGLKDKSIIVREAAIETLAKLKPPEFKNFLPKLILDYWQEYISKGYGSLSYFSLLTSAEFLWNIGGNEVAGETFEELHERADKFLLSRAEGKSILQKDLSYLKCAIAGALDSLDEKLSKVRGCGGKKFHKFEKLESARVLGNLKKAERIAILVARKLLSSQNSAVRVLTVRALGKIKTPLTIQLLTSLVGNSDRHVSTEAAVQLACILEPKKAIPLLFSSIEEIASPVEAMIPTLGTLYELFKTIKPTPPLDDFVRKNISTLLGHSDWGVASCAAQVISQSSGYIFHPSEKDRSSITQEIAYDILTSPLTTEVEVVTTRGNLKIELFNHEAPIAVRFFIALTKKGFYNNTLFYKILPQRMVWGGDPRGDGRGGPGFTIRDELNPVRFKRGTVGVDTLYPDTGGSRFFITLRDMPWLDGRYTAIGRVSSGIEVVEKLLPWDRILSASIKQKTIGSFFTPAIKMRDRFVPPIY